jgi:ferredoxin
MAQIFQRSANTLAKLSIIGAVLLATLAFTAVEAWQRSSYNTNQFEDREQPVQFSHKHHAGDDGIDCRYCHTAVEKSWNAGIPPTKTCMNCHSQIWADSPYLEPVRESWRTGKPIKWIKVHDLPDYVYFNHSIHVNKGVGCSTCHGNVTEMPLIYQASSLQMEWCLKCHRNPAPNLREQKTCT